MQLTSKPFGSIDAEPAQRFMLANDNGLSMAVLSYGGIIQQINVPDRLGQCENVALGYGSLSEYVPNNAYFGALVGRFANRIAHGRFELDGEVIQLTCNDGTNHLHGGNRSFSRRVWTVAPAESPGEVAIDLSLHSSDGEEGYPGNLEVEVRYALTNDNEVRVKYRAHSDRKTIVNLSQHSYFNLRGEGSGTALDHHVQINASRFIPVDESLNPTGEIRLVAGTPFDFQESSPISRGIRSSYDQIRLGRGYDHSFVIDRPPESEGVLIPSATLFDPASHRSLSVKTTEPGLQLYTGNFLNGSDIGFSKRAYRQGDGIALESQHFPDSPNQPGFPSVVIEAGETFTSETVYEFTW
ncbi:galactose mutarotase [soil metagenome]